MRHFITILTSSLMLTASYASYAKAPAHDVEFDLPVDNRIKILTYAQSDIYTIPTKYGYQTSIVFDSNEEIETVSVGDRSLWQIVPSKYRIFIRPMTDGLATNMTVITNHHEYHFDIKSVSGEHANNIYEAQFRYPDDKPTTPESTASQPAVSSPMAETVKAAPMQPVTQTTPMPEPKAPAVQTAPQIAPAVHETAGSAVSIPTLDTQRLQNPNYNYTYTGSDAVAPSRVYDDGRNTYIEFASKPDVMPIPYLMSDDGKEVMAVHSVKGSSIVIPTVASGWLLKSSAGELHVYNEMLTP